LIRRFDCLNQRYSQ